MSAKIVHITSTKTALTHSTSNSSRAKVASMSLNDTYRALLIAATTNGIETSPRGMLTRELIAARVEIDPNDNIITLPGFETNLEYAKAELEWYLSGTNKFKALGKFSKVWEKFSDDGETVNSAYGYQIYGNHPAVGIDQMKWVEDELRKDPDSRRAVVNINLPSHKDHHSKDLPCTIALEYLIRGGKLHAITYMRSNDIYFGFRNDIYCFTELQKILAKKLGIEAGTYFHIAGSLHIYKKQMDKVREVLLK